MARSSSPRRSPRAKRDDRSSETAKRFSFEADNPAKRWFEFLTLAWAAAWIAVYAVVVFTKAYMDWRDPGYLAISLFASVPHAILPLWFQDNDLPFGYGRDPERHLPLAERYWVKASVWIAILSFIGNYFWTHYFYVVLGAKYTFPVNLMLNDVPILCYLLTFAYFHFYHVFTNMAQRAFYASSVYRGSSGATQKILAVTMVFVLAYFTAFMETFTIQSVPYYSFEDWWSMYTIGSAFYGIYFYVSFPMFLQIEENPRESRMFTWQWTLWSTALHGLAANMIVTLGLDFWRLAIGHVGSGSETTLGGPPFVR